MHRSLSMGVPAPMHAGAAGGRWEPDDISGFFTRREWFYNPLTSSTVKVLAEHNGKAVERYVAVLSLGPLPDITWPESGRDPWMLASDKLGFPVEWSMAGAMLDPKDLTAAIEFEQNRAAGISSHYAEHNLIPPPAVERAIEGATLNLDEVTEGDTRTAVRFLGPIRLATYAASEAECLEQARALVDAYGERMNFELAHPRGQAQLLREFVPGRAVVDGRATSGGCRRSTWPRRCRTWTPRWVRRPGPTWRTGSARPGGRCGSTRTTARRRCSSRACSPSPPSRAAASPC